MLLLPNEFAGTPNVTLKFNFYMINNQSVKFDKDLNAGSVFRRMTLTYASLH